MWSDTQRICTCELVSVSHTLKFQCEVLVLAKQMTAVFLVSDVSSSYRMDFDVSHEDLPHPRSVPKSAIAAKALKAVRGDLSAVKSCKMGQTVDMEAAEHLAERLKHEVHARAACGCCHGCCAGLPGGADILVAKDALKPMTRKQAMAKFKHGTCLMIESQMAMAIGKRGSALFALQEQSIGLKVWVRILSF
jgi:hypothetical protein